MIFNLLILVLAIIAVVWNIMIYTNKKLPSTLRANEATLNVIVTALLIFMLIFFNINRIISYIIIIIIIALLPFLYKYHVMGKQAKLKYKMKFRILSTNKDGLNFSQIVSGMQLYYQLLHVLSESYDSESANRLNEVKAIVKIRFDSLSQRGKNIVKKDKVIQYLLRAQAPKNQADARIKSREMTRVMKQSLRGK